MAKRPNMADEANAAQRSDNEINHKVKTVLYKQRMKLQNISLSRLLPEASAATSAKPHIYWWEAHYPKMEFIQTGHYQEGQWFVTKCLDNRRKGVRQDIVRRKKFRQRMTQIICMLIWLCTVNLGICSSFPAL